MSVGVWRATSSVFWDMAQVPHRSEHGSRPPEVNMEVDPLMEVNMEVDPLEVNPPKKGQMSVGVWRATSSVFWDMAWVPEVNTEVDPPPRIEHRSGPPEVNMEVDPPRSEHRSGPPQK